MEERDERRRHSTWPAPLLLPLPSRLSSTRCSSETGQGWSRARSHPGSCSCLKLATKLAGLRWSIPLTCVAMATVVLRMAASWFGLAAPPAGRQAGRHGMPGAMPCSVMPCGVMSWCHTMQCHVLVSCHGAMPWCHVIMSCHALSCHGGMSWCHVMQCSSMQADILL